MIAGIISIILLIVGIIMFTKGCEEDNALFGVIGFCLTAFCMYLVGLFISLNADTFINWFKM